MIKNLYKAKSLMNGFWFQGDLITDNKEFNRTCDSAFILPHWKTLNAPIECDIRTVCRFTGKLDINRNEIFNNDIVFCLFDNLIRIVEWSNREYTFKLKNIDGQDYTDIRLSDGEFIYLYSKYDKMKINKGDK